MGTMLYRYSVFLLDLVRPYMCNLSVVHVIYQGKKDEGV